MRILLLSFFVFICSLISVNTQINNYELDHHRRHHTVTIHQSNSADVYLIAQFLACLFSYSRHTAKLPSILTTPLGILADRIFIQEIHDDVIFWNKITGRTLLIMKEKKLKSVYHDLDTTAKLDHINLECVFNELIGVNNQAVTHLSNDVFQYLGSVLAEILGVDSKPKGVLNLNGILLIAPTFGPRNSGITDKTPLHDLFLIADNSELTVHLARQSLIIDASAYWNLKYLFQECSDVQNTQSGYQIGSLVGDVNLISVLEEATKALLTIIKPPDLPKLLSDVFTAIALDCKIGFQFAPLFGDPPPSPHAIAICHGVHPDNHIPAHNHTEPAVPNHTEPAHVEHGHSHDHART